MGSNRITPNSREGLSAQSTITGQQEYISSTNNVLNVNGSFTVTGSATSVNQTNGAQKTQIVDGAGNVVGSTSNALDVNIKSGSSSGTQYAELTTTSPATGTVALGRYVSTPPTLTNGQLYAPQLDANGNLKVSIAAGGGSGGTASSFGSAFPATGTAIGQSDGTNMVAFRGDTTNGTWVNLKTAIPTGTNAIGSITNTSFIATQTTGTNLHTVVDSGSITANAGTNLNTSALALETGGNLATIATNTTTLSITQASTTSGQRGILNLGAVTTAAPTYTTGQSSALSLDTAGNLRTSVNNTVTITGTVTSTPSGTQNVNNAQIAGTTTSVNNGTTDAGTQRVTLSSDSTGQVKLAAGAATIGAISNTSFTATQATGSNLHVVVDSGTVTATPPALPSTIINGQKAVTSTVSALSSGALTQGVIIEALSTNTVSVFIGGSGVTATTGIELLPGGSTSFAVSNTNLINVITASGTATVTYAGS